METSNTLQKMIYCLSARMMVNWASSCESFQALPQFSNEVPLFCRHFLANDWTRRYPRAWPSVSSEEPILWAAFALQHPAALVGPFWVAFIVWYLHLAFPVLSVFFTIVSSFKAFAVLLSFSIYFPGSTFGRIIYLSLGFKRMVYMGIQQEKEQRIIYI